jgi:glycolate oxidase FAD binding subunit
MVERLAAIVSAGAVVSGAEAGRWAVHGRVPRAVVAPGTAEEAAAVLALASEAGWRVEAAGAGTLLDAGRPTEGVDLVVTTERLSGIVAHEPADLVASVGAGTSLGELGRRLAPHRQWLPLDPPGAQVATLGAVVSMASAGPLRRGHGTPRDHVLGLQIVTGDGRILDLGGRVVKNVAGYDLVKLVVGSRGTLGLVTRVEVRLRAIPEADRTLRLVAAEPEPLLHVAEALRAERIEPVALELSTAGVTGWELLARFQGNAEAVAHAAARLSAIAAGIGGVGLDEGSDADGGGVWERLGASEVAAGVVVRLADRPSALGQTLAFASALPGASIVAHAGDGIVRALLSAEAVAAAPARWAATLSEARAALAGRGGTLIVARAPRALVEAFDPWGDAGAALGLMRRLKQEFDPAGVLGPGRFVV